MDKRLTDTQKEMYKRNNPDSGEEDIRMYEMHRIKNKSAISIAQDVVFQKRRCIDELKGLNRFWNRNSFIMILALWNTYTLDM